MAEELNTVDIGAALVVALIDLAPVPLPPPPQWLDGMHLVEQLDMTMEEAATSPIARDIERRFQWIEMPVSRSIHNGLVIRRLNQAKATPMIQDTPDGW